VHSEKTLIIVFAFNDLGAGVTLPINMGKIKLYFRYYLEHLEELLLDHCNPVLQAKYFGLIFNEAPTYADIVSGSPDISKIKGVNALFLSAKLFNETYGWGNGMQTHHSKIKI